MQEKRILFVCRPLVSATDGGLRVVNRNLKLFMDLYGASSVDLLEIPSPSYATRIKNLFLAESYGHTPALRNKLLNMINNNSYMFVYFDRSIYGGYVRTCALQNVPTLVFFQNVDYDFYSEKFKVSRSVVDFVTIPYVYFNERRSVKHGTKLVTLTDKDSKKLQYYYKKKSDLILPTSFDDHNVSHKKRRTKDIRYCLFVGSKLYANIQGMRWFIKNVAPFTSYEYWIVGDVCDSLKDVIGNANNNIVLKGYVENLDDVYRNAEAIISPIFYGAGLKTKTIEALQYGKSIIGTSEAFAGINIDYELVGGLCDDARSFIVRLNERYACQPSNYNEYAHDYYLNNYSYEVIYERLKMALIEWGWI